MLYEVSRCEQERLGGHASSRHVAMSENTLIASVLERGQRITARGGWFTGLSEGSFTSLDSATELVNATLAANREAVDAVARGEARSEFVEARFNGRRLRGLSARPKFESVYWRYKRGQCIHPAGFPCPERFPRTECLSDELVSYVESTGLHNPPLRRGRSDAVQPEGRGRVPAGKDFSRYGNRSSLPTRAVAASSSRT